MNAQRFSRLVSAASEGLMERGHVVASALLSILSGQSVFFFGPPGTAKSLIARRLAGVFRESRFFECLMNRFTTPEELFGPVSIKELKTADRYVRKTEGFLPSVDFAFLDEIWKSSPAILNSLLTILNERRFRNGDHVEDVPLKAIVAASNELPQANQGLEALYDRFIMRFLVPPVREVESFESLLCGGGVDATVSIPDDEKITNEEWDGVRLGLSSIKISPDALSAIKSIRKKLAKVSDGGAAVYVSDRRWIKATLVARTAASVCGRMEVLPNDLAVLADCLWEKESDRDRVNEVVTSAVVKYSVRGTSALKSLMTKFDAFESGVLKRDFWDRDSGTTVMIGDIECYEIPSSYLRGEAAHNLYIPISKGCKCEAFYPLTRNGTEYSLVTCLSDGAGQFQIQGKGRGENGTSSVLGNYIASRTFVPKVAVHAGDDKPVSRRTLAADFKEAQAYVTQLETITQANVGTSNSETPALLPFIADRFAERIAQSKKDFEQALADAKVRVDHLTYKLQRHSSWQR